VKLKHPIRGMYTWAFHDSAELGPVILKKIGEKTGLRPEDI
jgi:predicted RNA binding protein YcfA (HicA-like mRNA interferase family)